MRVPTIIALTAVVTALLTMATALPFLNHRIIVLTDDSQIAVVSESFLQERDRLKALAMAGAAINVWDPIPIGPWAGVDQTILDELNDMESTSF